MFEICTWMVVGFLVSLAITRSIVSAIACSVCLFLLFAFRLAEESEMDCDDEF